MMTWLNKNKIFVSVTLSYSNFGFLIRTFMDCILDNALKGLNPLNVRMLLNTGMLPAPTQVADKLSRETLNVSKNIFHQIFY